MSTAEIDLAAGYHARFGLDAPANFASELAQSGLAPEALEEDPAGHVGGHQRVGHDGLEEVGVVVLDGEHGSIPAAARLRTISGHLPDDVVGVWRQESARAAERFLRQIRGDIGSST